MSSSLPFPGCSLWNASVGTCRLLFEFHPTVFPFRKAPPFFGHTMERPSSADTFIGRGKVAIRIVTCWFYIKCTCRLLSQLGLLWTCWKSESGDKYVKDGQDGAQERDMFIDRASFHSESTKDLTLFFPPHRCRFTSNFPDSLVFVLFWMHTSFSWNWRTRSFQEHL